MRDVSWIEILLIACSSTSHQPASETDASPQGQGSSADPFAPQADESEVLTNSSADLDALLEHGALTGACDRYRAGATDRKTMLLCGKWMYFYETFGTVGMPSALVKFMAKNFPAELGLGFANLGMVPDPASADAMPLGFAPTTPFAGNVEAVAFTCAGCHFGRLPDGRYAVGAPNHAIDYGRYILTLMIAPLPIDDQVHIVSKIIGLWAIPRPAEATAAGMTTALLAWTGDAHSLDEFVEGFATLGGSAPPTADAMRPLLEYIYSLRAPTNPMPPDPALVASGAALYRDKGCATCHDGPRGSGTRAYTFAEIGTDPALAGWADPTQSGSACCGLDIEPGQLTHGVKSPRLVGTWALGRFLHDGALTSLDQLFCLTPRPPTGTEPMRSDGHAFTCDGLSDDDKHALEAYLLAH